MVFACTKCNQYTYGKKEQKGKKCPRCGRNHKMLDVIPNGVIVENLTEANLLVRQKQIDLALNKSGAKSGFKFSNSNFDLAKNFTDKPLAKQKKEKMVRDPEEVGPTYHEYLDFIENLKKEYSEGPLYVINIFMRDKKVPFHKVREHNKKMIKEGRMQVFTKTPNLKYYKIPS